MYKIKCEICNFKTCRIGQRKRYFMAKFPINKERCKKWVAATGNEDLVYVPIEKLHQLKYVCDRHFRPKDFNKKRTQLKKRAVPCIDISVEPLTDDMLKDFPLHIFKSEIPSYALKDHNYYCSETMEQNSQEGTKNENVTKSSNTAGGATAANSKNIADGVDIQEGTAITDSPNTLLASCVDPQGGADEYICDDDTLVETEEQLFSWQRDSEINCDDLYIVPDNTAASDEYSAAMTEYDAVKKTSLEEIKSETDNQGINRDEEDDLHKGYQCDMCNRPIYRFRYSCVECANYDLCAACEARAVHPEHYMLRVPRPRPHGEIQLIMDTIRRYLTADLKSIRAEANFVDTLMDEMKSEVLSQADSDPVPDEPDYPLHSVDSGDEHDDFQMEESNVSLTPATQDRDAQHVDDCLDENNLQEWEFPHEIYKTQEPIHNRAVNIVKVQRPKGRIINEINRSLPATLGNVRHKVLVSCPNTDSVCDDVHMKHVPERRTVNTTNKPSPSNTLGKVGERLCVTYPMIGSFRYKRIQLMPEQSIVQKTVAGLSASNALENVSDRLLGTSPKKVISYVPKRKQELGVISKIDGISSSNTIGKVSKKTLVTCPKTVSISNDVLKLLKSKDGDIMQTTINTIKHSLQSKVSIQLERISQDQINPQ